MGGSAIPVTLGSFVALALAYVTYGRFMARRIYRLDASRPTPAHTLKDGVDYVPTRIPVLFGHHFASIAGLGPILGPAVAVIWGWLPAVLWVVLGSILIGAVHDLGALTVSLRYQGRSIGDVCREIIGPRARLLFLLIIFFLMSLAMGAFVNAISSLFVSFNPDAIIPSFGLMVVAMCIGLAVYRFGLGLGPVTVLGLLVFGGLIAWGVSHPVTSYEWFAGAETNSQLQAAREAPALEGAATAWRTPYGAAAGQTYLSSVGMTQLAEDLVNAEARAKRMWIFVLLGYGFVASVLPVWLLLQPRDYINSFQLYIALLFLVIGLVVSGLSGSEAGMIHAPLVRAYVADAPPALPFLFVTIACGAVSGFHSLVSSGTTVRQLNRETDALPIGFGGMLTEGALAVLVIMACAAGLGASAWQDGGAYSSWKSAGGLAVPLSAVVRGGANYLLAVGVPLKYGMAFLAVTVVAFAMTTLDSATRLLRFNVEEIFRSLQLEALANRYVASLVAVGGISLFALLPAGKTLWVMFGTTNQLLAGLTLLTVTLFLFKLGRPVVFTLLPMILMMTMTVWAMLWSLADFFKQDQPPRMLITVSLVLMVMTVWMVIEAALSFGRGRGGLNLDESETSLVDHEPADMTDAAHLG